MEGLPAADGKSMTGSTMMDATCKGRWLGACVCFLCALMVAACESLAAVEQLPDLAYHDHLHGDRVVLIPERAIVTPPAAPPATRLQGSAASIIPRSTWTRLPLKLADGVRMNGPQRITVHHSGDGKPFLADSPADVAAHLRVVQQAHLRRGMDDIAYHFAIDRAGRIWQLRWLGYEGQHVRASKNGTRNNEHNIGIVLLGDFNVQDSPVAQRERLYWLIRELRLMYSSTGGGLPVHFHGELVDTDCPGMRLLPYLKEARRQGLF